jgi:hypothetical protein
MIDIGMDVDQDVAEGDQAPVFQGLRDRRRVRFCELRGGFADSLELALDRDL